jgi:hypothetical protein
MMTSTELANKIAEEFFRTIERENAIVKAEIVEAVERVLAKEISAPLSDEWKRKSAQAFAEQMAIAGSLPNQGGFIRRGVELDVTKFKLGEWKRLPSPHATGDWWKMVTAAFDHFAQQDGPARAYYEVPSSDGLQRYSYVEYAWKSDDALKIASRVDELAAKLKSSGVHTIIWRSRPEKHYHRDSGKHEFYCRFHAMPYAATPESNLLEGEAFPEA